MPTVYRKKESCGRGNWSEESLNDAVNAVVEKKMGENAAAKEFGIPKTTLKRRLKSNNFTKGPMGPCSILGAVNEAKIVGHIKKLQDQGFTPCRNSVRAMAYELAETLKLTHNFNMEEKMAGYDWLQSFLNRNPTISIRKSDGVSVNRARGMTKSVVKDYFNLLEKVLNENELINKPLHVFNMDETGLQLNNKPGEALAIKGSKNVTSITSGEKGETVSVLTCVNGEGTFLPPYCIMKGKYAKTEFTDGMPPGSQVRMSQKSAYVNSEIFLDWLKTHFLPRKPIGKVLLLLDGHISHTSCLETLEFANENNVILMSLPPHTSHWLQPLDRSFFKSLTSNFYAACNNLMVNNPCREINRLQFGMLLNTAWSKSANVDNGVKCFNACGVIPLNLAAIPEYAYLTATRSNEDPIVSTNMQTHPVHQDNLAQPSSSRDTPTSFQLPQGYESPTKATSIQQTKQTPSNNNLSKLLNKISPVPTLEMRKVIRPKRKTQTVSTILNSPENIANIKKRKEENKIKAIEKENKQRKRLISMKKENKSPKFKKAIKNQDDSSTSESDYNISDIVQDDDDCLLEDWDEDECVGCGENYNKTNKKEDWIKCVTCSRWFHDGCSRYGDKCHYCGKREIMNQKIKFVKRVFKKEKL